MALMSDIVSSVNAAFGQNVPLHITPELNATFQAREAVVGMEPLASTHVETQGAATHIRDAEALATEAARGA